MGQYSQFVMSLRRLYENHKLPETIVVEMCLKYNLSEEDKKYILGKS